MKRPTQVDVARIAGVSRGTVSYVISGGTDGCIPVSEETRKRVLAVIEELGYVPDASARALRSGDPKTIGLVIPDIRNPHFWDNVNGVEQAVHAAGYHLLLSNLGIRNEFGEDIYRDLRSQRISGLILMGSYADRSKEALKTLEQLLRRQLSIVEISDGLYTEHNVDYVVSSYREATAEVISYLLSLGHQRIGLIYGVAIPQLAFDRLEPYQASLQAAGIPLDPDLILNLGPTIEDGYQAAMQLLNLPVPPTALIAINDLQAIGAIRAATDCELRIPEDLSLVGFDNIFVTDYLVPRLSTVTKDAEKMGCEAVRLVLERIEDPDHPRQVIEFPARFIVRDSIGPAKVK